MIVKYSRAIVPVVPFLENTKSLELVPSLEVEAAVAVLVLLPLLPLFPLLLFNRKLVFNRLMRALRDDADCTTVEWWPWESMYSMMLLKCTTISLIN